MDCDGLLLPYIFVEVFKTKNINQRGFVVWVSRLHTWPDHQLDEIGSSTEKGT